ncbi:hypothetical protein [Paenibacillus pini]|uniref:Uncharacterized protein n=1 Tax=Paenibacillus pini JCM 16418 TaxID=1236976 RepID=W7YN46_9BACL|nr:hypothetical protein [Paenibacillus pini]GAF09053.1 hypothetical protein JCM16418_3171 [Paenibacillus pini JCM 16418]
MKRFIFPSVTMLVTLGAAMLLPQFYVVHTSAAQQQSVVSTFNPYSQLMLSNDNIVDSLANLPLTLQIGSVEWENSILTIDLKVITPETTIPEIYNNLAEFVNFCFQRTSNVDQLMLRLVAEDKWLGTKHLLLAANIHREDWSADLNQQLDNTGEESLSEIVKQRFHVTETKLWRNQFTQP